MNKTRTITLSIMLLFVVCVLVGCNNACSDHTDAENWLHNEVYYMYSSDLRTFEYSVGVYRTPIVTCNTFYKYYVPGATTTEKSDNRYEEIIKLLECDPDTAQPVNKTVSEMLDYAKEQGMLEVVTKLVETRETNKEVPANIDVHFVSDDGFVYCALIPFTDVYHPTETTEKVTFYRYNLIGSTDNYKALAKYTR